jgi:hypothetical protein
MMSHITFHPEGGFDVDLVFLLKKIRDRATTPGTPARSKWSSDEALSDGTPAHGEAVASRMGTARP